MGDANANVVVRHRSTPMDAKSVPKPPERPSDTVTGSHGVAWLAHPPAAVDKKQLRVLRKDNAPFALQDVNGRDYGMTATWAIAWIPIREKFVGPAYSA